MKTAARYYRGLLWALALAGLCSWASAATVNVVTGGDPGEGLDLEGNFLYAVNVGPIGAIGKIRDADFTTDTAGGVTVVATDAAAIWGTINLGDTANDNNIEKLFASIRHVFTSATAPPYQPLRIILQGLEPGADYKLQLLFWELGWNRGFDIFFNDTLLMDDFNPGNEQGGIDMHEVAACVVTHEFKAATNSIEIRLDSVDVTVDYADHNPTISGLTLERLSAVSDNDGDGLPDDWEMKYFSNLDQKQTDDPDQDNLANSVEYSVGSDPNRKDTDGDTLTDDTEVNTHHTSPTKADTDGDGIADNVELASTKTDPIKADTDGDLYSDYDELRMITDPLNKDNYPEKTTITLFTGGELGEGLDLEGTFLYAINVGPPDALGQIRDAVFTEDTVDGVAVSGGFIAGGWHTGVSFGDAVEDEALEIIMSSIRWSDAGHPQTPTLRLSFANLEAGAAYKMQMLFAEEAWTRGFDITVDGRFILDDFSPWHYQGGFPKTNGAVVTHNFIASTNSVLVILDGRTVTLPEFTDHNPILQAATLELIAPNRDSDNDTLPDPWEIDQFGNLNETASGDPDDDDVPNSQEFSVGTSALKADTDADGLNDSEEINTSKTNPLKADTDTDMLSDYDEVKTHNTDPLVIDTDADGLLDGNEANVLHTNPTKADTDGDTVGDYDELRHLTNPTDAGSRPANLLMSVFTGGDPGEGLDLEGMFVYAINIGPTEPIGTIRDAVFTEDSVEGVTVLGGNAAAGWHDPYYGDTEPDMLLQLVMSSIRWSDAASATQPTLRINMGNLTAGHRYKLQLLFAEQGWARGFDVLIDGVPLLDDFSPVHYMGGFVKDRGIVVTHIFDAATNSVLVTLDGRGVTTPGITDRNAEIQAATLEDLGLAPVLPRITGATVDGSGVHVTFTSVAGVTYGLQYKQSLTDANWQEVTGTVTAAGNSSTLTDGNASHQSPAQGYWRITVK